MRLHQFASLFLLSFLLAAPVGAHASSIGVENGVLTYSADPSEHNEVTITRQPDGEYYVYDSATQPQGSPPGPSSPGITVRIGAGCREVQETYSKHYECTSDVSAIRVSLNDLDDSLCADVLGAPLTYSGGDSVDTARVCGATPPAVTIDTDGVADDGPDGRDNYEPDVERVEGGAAADVLSAGPNATLLGGGAGNDTLRGGPAKDTLRSASFQEFPPDVPTFQTEGVDTVSCGRGPDQVLADTRDRVARDCEIVIRGLVDVDGIRGFEYRGSSGADAIYPVRLWDPARVRAGAGDDRIRAGEIISAGSGNDRTYAIDGLAQDVSGGKGNDIIYVNDRRRDEGDRDTVKCGTGKDKVVANKDDKVARDCEKVKRVK